MALPPGPGRSPYSFVRSLRHCSDIPFHLSFRNSVVNSGHVTGLNANRICPFLPRIRNCFAAFVPWLEEEDEKERQNHVLRHSSAISSRTKWVDQGRSFLAHRYLPFD